MEQEYHRRALPQSYRSFPLSLALVAGLCWAGAILLLLMGNLREYDSFFAPLRLVFYVAVFLGGFFTFVPTERRLELPGLAFEGIGGSALLAYTLAFVPPPTAWLLALPDIPVYALLIVSLFWFVSASAMPLIHIVGLYIYRNRAHQFDLRRVKRQAHEVGTFAALVGVLAGLRVLTGVSLLLLALILFIAELLFLSRVKPDGATAPVIDDKATDI